MEYELGDFRMKKASDLTKARDEKDRNRTPDNISKWKKVMADLKVIDNALRAGATTLAELKEFAKDDASFIAEIDELLAKPTPQSVSAKKIGLFSARLEALINSALQDGVLTDQEKAILKKRAEAEGEDWDEVEMIINARLAERRPTPPPIPPIPPIISVTNENDKVNKSPSVQQPKCSEDCKASNDELENVVESQYLIVNGTVYKEFVKSGINPKIIQNFAGNVDFISVTIPTCVNKINDFAFYQCSGLTNITFSDNSVTGIGYSAFKECENLETVIFPSSLKKIESEAFKECVNLKKVDFSRCDKLEEIGFSAFENCENLETVIFPSSLKKIEYNTFEDCDNLTEVDFSRCDKLEEIGKSAFRLCKNLETVILPSSLKKIEYEAFKEFVNLKKVDFSRCDKLEEIGKSAFQLCKNLETVILPSSLKKIENEAFKECVNLKKVDFSRCDKLEEIGESAFQLCKNLETVILPSSLKKIVCSAFEDCDNLTEVDFSRCDKLEVIGSSAFENCKNLETVILPSSLKMIESAFRKCVNLKKVDFSRCDKLEEISSAFDGCKKLEKVDFSHCKSLKFCSRYVLSECDNIRIIDFSGCINLSLDYGEYVLDVPGQNLEKLIFPAGQKVFNAMCIWDQFGYNVDISNCKNLTSVGSFKEMKMKEIVFPDSIEIIGTDDDDYGLFYKCENLKTIVMPAALKEIKPPLGKCMEQLKKVDFSKVTQLKTIPKKLFSYGCHKLKELIIPNGVTEIEDDAFVELDALKRLFLPPTLESIGDLGQRRVSVYCFSPTLEELEPLVYGWDDDDDDDDDWDDGLEDLKEEKKKIKINLFVLPQYLDKYIAQRKAERIPEDVLIIQEIPEEYRYYYDN